LLRFTIENDEATVSLPQLYPGGAPVVVGVRRDQDSYIVSDRGGGYLQAEQAGGHLQFARLAPATAKEHDVRFDGHLMFTVEVPSDWVPNAIIFIAAASNRAVELTLQRLAEEKDNSARNQLREVLSFTYGERVSFDVDYSGHSTRKHHFAAMFRDQRRTALFDLVTPHHVSINSTFVKFADVGRLEEAPSRVAVLSNEARMSAGDINLISETANFVVPVSSDVGKVPIAA
jgi:hypothetical protein